MATDLASVYSSKTDDELLALAADHASLEPEARPVLWAELGRRKLTDPHLWRGAVLDEVPFLAQNPAFNIPAKIATALLLVFVVSFGLFLMIAVEESHQVFTFALVFILVWGPIFAAIAWATRRALRNRPKHEKDS